MDTLYDGRRFRTLNVKREDTRVTALPAGTSPSGSVGFLHPVWALSWSYVTEYPELNTKTLRT